MIYTREADEIVADFREVERHLRRVVEGTPEAMALHRESERLLEEHRRLTAEASGHGQSVPTFPTSERSDSV